MRFAGHRILRAAALAGATHLLPALLLAQAPTLPAAQAPSNPIPPPPIVRQPPALPPHAPPLPFVRSPIGFFRELLLMSPAERIQALTNRPPELRAQILGKVREYLALKPDERELRLRATELRWYLWPLLTTPSTNRITLLALIPPADRELVVDRLREWDKLPPAVQKELLGIEPTLRYFADIEGLSSLERERLLAGISPAHQRLLEKGVQQWDAMSEDQRQNTLHRFNRFFTLTVAEKQKALNTLSEPERKQIEKTLQSFGKLLPEQRALCIRSFAKFASLSLDERQQFLKNAERWKQMSPSERQAWRQLVNRLPPPLPPRMPPPVPTLSRSRTAPAMFTNGN